MSWRKTEMMRCSRKQADTVSPQSSIGRRCNCPIKRGGAVVLYLNIEHFPENDPGPAIVPGTTKFSPDPLNSGWRDYGMRVNFWRLAEIFEKVGARASTAGEFGQLIRDQFDILYAESATRAKIMLICLHNFIPGRPFRAKHLAAALQYISFHAGVWFATSGEINAWFREAYRDGFN